MSFRGEPIGPVATVAFIVFGSLEVLSGVLGNVLLLSVLFTSRLLGQANCHNLFIVNLALTDLVILGYWMPFFVLDLLLGYNPAVNQAHCEANGFIVCLCTIVSMLTLASISLNRYLHVCHSRLYRRVFNRNNTVACCLLLWLIGAGISAPPFFTNGSLGSYYFKNATHTCTFTSDTYPRVMTVILMVGSTLSIVYFNFAIFRFWRRAKLNLRTRRMPLPRGTCCVFCQRGSVSLQETEGDDGQKEVSPDTESNALTASNMADTESNDPTASNTADASGSGSSQQPTSSTVTHPVPVTISSAAGMQPHGQQGLHGGNSDYRSKTGQMEETDSVRDTGSDGKTTPVGETALNPSATEVAFGTRFPKGNRVPKSDFSSERINAACSFSTKNATPSGTKKRSVHTSHAYRQQLARRRRKQQGRERAFVRSLAVISLLMVLSFLPFGISRVFEKSHPFSAEVAISLTLLLFVNCSLNWAVYGIMNRSFRREYAKLMKRIWAACCRCQKPNTSYNT